MFLWQTNKHFDGIFYSLNRIRFLVSHNYIARLIWTGYSDTGQKLE